METWRFKIIRADGKNIFQTRCWAIMYSTEFCIFMAVSTAKS